MRGGGGPSGACPCGRAAAAIVPEVITRAVWDDGHVSAVTGRKGDVMEMTGGPRGAHRSPTGRNAGLIPLSADSDIGGRMVFDWPHPCRGWPIWCRGRPSIWRQAKRDDAGGAGAPADRVGAQRRSRSAIARSR